MIEVYEGRIGSSKTYHAVRTMFEYMVEGGTVCSNIKLNFNEVKNLGKERYGVDLQDRQYIFLKDEEVYRFHHSTPSGTKQKPSLVVIDEAHIWFNSRDWHKADREFLVFLTQSRHVHTDIIFISQAIKNIDSQIQRLVEHIWRHRDWRKFGLFGFSFQKIEKYISHPFLWVQYDYTGKAILGKRKVKDDEKIFKLYDSFANVRDFMRSGTVNPVDVGEKKQERKTTWIYPVIIGGVLLYAVNGCRTVKKEEKKESKESQVQAVEKILKDREKAIKKEDENFEESRICSVIYYDSSKQSGYVRDTAGRKFRAGEWVKESGGRIASFDMEGIYDYKGNNLYKPKRIKKEANTGRLAAEGGMPAPGWF